MNFFKIKDGGNNFAKISTGFQHSLFLTHDGRVFGCGKYDKMQLGKKFTEIGKQKYGTKGN